MNSTNTSSYTVPDMIHRVKVVVVGDGEVGKTSLIVRFTKGIFSLSYLMTIGVNFFVKDVNTEDKTVRLVIWDTGGQEQFGYIRQHYFVGSKGALICYDKSDTESFKRLDYWRNQIIQYCGNIPIIVVGCKADLPAAISYDVGRQYAFQHRAGFAETSSKTGQNVSQTFSLLARLVLQYYSQRLSTPSE
ncbi:MAG: Rab family GTPase [Promethearchaeota archaeon]